MILIIDGYNVLKQAKGAAASESEKQTLVNKIVRYAQEKRHKAIVVFDGGYVLYPSKEHSGSVTVIHVGYGHIADDYIKRLIEQKKNKELLLASSDNELCFFAHRRGIATIDALAFFKLLHEKEASVSSAVQGAGLHKFSTATDNAELDAVMEETTRRIPLKKEEKASTRERKPQRSKYERKLLKKIDKL